MLTADGDARRLATRYLDVVDKAGERRNAADEEGGDCAPVGGELGRVAVHAVEVVHVRHGDSSSSDNEVAAVMMCQWMDVRIWGIGEHELADQNRCHGSQEDGIATEESKELCGRGQDFPLQP